MYIKLPRYLFFYMTLGPNDFDAVKSITEKSLDFQGQPLPLVLIMDAARIKIIKSRAI